jgi:DNA-binding response OmpR family regulator
MAVHRVLVVDDNHEIRRMVTASIKTLGAEVDVLDVPSAEEALFISASLSLDLVVLDFRLPGMSGLEMVNWLRKRMPETKIILVTGVEDVATRRQISEAGVAAYFFKPIEIATFLDAVRNCLWSDLNELSLTADQASVSGGPSLSSKPSISERPSTNEAKPSATKKFEARLDERLTTLKGQVRAISVLLVNETGQVMEVAGNPSLVTSGSVLHPALLEAFRASQKVTNAMGKGPIDSLLYFTDAKQRIYLAPVDPSNALLMVTIGYSEPDKLGLLDRAIHRAVHDLRDILDQMNVEESLQLANAEVKQTELPAEIIVDPETLAGVVEIFSQASKGGGKEEAEGFWETLGENSQLDGVSNKDVLTYDQARDMGLAPNDDIQP